MKLPCLAFGHKWKRYVSTPHWEWCQRCQKDRLLMQPKERER